MPIPRELRHLYSGPEYEAQRARILARDRNECKWCAKPNGTLVQTKTGLGRMFYRRVEKHAAGIRPLSAWLNEDGWKMIREDHDAAMLLGAPRVIKVVLAMAHLNHDPADRRDENVAMLCQWCHLHHDRDQHRRTLVRNRDNGRPLCREVVKIA